MRQATRERQARILTELLEKKQVMIRDLADGMAISEATIRRDLRALSDSQKALLIHGGATLPSQTYFSFDAKLHRNLDAKHVIGRIAVSLIQNGDQIFLDAGTTTFTIAQLLSARRGLSILVNSARLTLEIQSPGSNLIMIGGQYRPERMDNIGPMALAALEQLRGYIAFIGADGLSQDFGVSAADIDSAHLYRLAITNARETVLLVDHSKFESASLFRMVGWDRVTRIVTDRLPSADWMDFLSAHSIAVHHPGNTNLNGDHHNGDFHA